MNAPLSSLLGGVTASFSRFSGDKRKPKLLDQVRLAIRTKHYSIRTEEAYMQRIKRFILFHHTLNQARTRLGLHSLRWYFAQYDRAARVVGLMSPHFDFPAQGMPPNVRLVGTPLGEVAPPPWSPPWSTAERQPRLLVSLSTLNQGQAPLMERILVALAGLPVCAVVRLGPALAASQFTPPPNVILETFISHAAVLPHVDAMVTQCGLGTLMKALVHGVPLVCNPPGGRPA